MTKRQVKSACPYCGVGCGIVMTVEDDRIVKVSGDKDHPANFGRLCTKGITCGQAVAQPGRADKAFFRAARDGEKKPVPMAAAITRTATAIRAIIDTHGPDSFGFYVSGQMSMEAQYLANKLAKGFIGTNNIESNSRLCMASAASGYKQSLGADGPPGSYEDFDRADLFFVIGANMADCHPILYLRMLDRVKAGAKLIVTDPRRTATAEKADLFLQIKPGTDLALLNGLLHLLARNDHLDTGFIAAYTEGWEAMPDLLAHYTPEIVAGLTGLAEADIRQAALWIGGAPEWMSCWTMGLNQSTHGTWSTNAICNLHLATGKICRPGSGPFSLTGQPNAMGGREMGYMGNGLPGQRATASAADRIFVEDLWKVPRGTLRAETASGTVQMFEDMAAGRIKACWIICTNPVASAPNRKTVIAGLEAAELVITQDSYIDTETTFYADITLPGALWAEGEGVMVNSERNLTLLSKAVEPPGDALPDWQIIARVACDMGYGDAFSYHTAEDVFEEIRQAWNPETGYDVRGAHYARLRTTPLQWPCPPGAAADRNPIRYINDGVSQDLRPGIDGTRPAFVFPTEHGRAMFLPRPHMDAAEMPDAGYPLVLNTGRLPHQWHTLTKTAKISTLNKLNPGPFIEIHPQDAQVLCIRDQDQIEIRSRRGRAILPAVVTDRVLRGNCFAPFHWSDLFGADLAINAVTSDEVDPVSLQPEFKFCAVALAKVAATAGRETKALENSVLAGLGLAPLATPASNETGMRCLSGFMTITVLWASQTGNSEALAERLSVELRKAGLKTHLSCMADYDIGQLGHAGTVLLISSTYGDGDPPDNGKSFWSSLCADDARDLSDLGYAVCALGDSSYDQFCQHGKNLDVRLAALGAKRLVGRADCDADDEDRAGDWMSVILQRLTGAAADAGATVPVAKTAGQYSKNKPFAARLLANVKLNGAASGKDTRFIALSLDDAGITYEAGDALGVWPTNCPHLVDEVIMAAGLQADAPVTVGKAGHVPLRQALRETFELTRPSRDTLEFIAARCAGFDLRDLLSDGRKQALKDWLWGKQLADVLMEFPVRTAAQEFVAALKHIQPRLYSIASSPRAHRGQAHLTVAAVRFGEKARKGACSTYLADRAADSAVSVFVQTSAHFRLPADPATPIIMIGPGTGVAPFRAFLHDRRATGAAGRNWLFFGERHRATDFYYQDELDAMRQDGFLTELSLAFSRDQAEKIYVQQRMMERGREIWSWLQDGAHVYVCGDANQMAKDVEAALLTITEQRGGLRKESAQDYVRSLAREKRYLRDVY